MGGRPIGGSATKAREKSFDIGSISWRCNSLSISVVDGRDQMSVGEDTTSGYASSSVQNKNEQQTRLER